MSKSIEKESRLVVDRAARGWNGAQPFNGYRISFWG